MFRLILCVDVLESVTGAKFDDQIFMGLLAVELGLNRLESPSGDPS